MKGLINLLYNLKYYYECNFLKVRGFGVLGSCTVLKGRSISRDVYRYRATGSPLRTRSCAFVQKHTAVVPIMGIICGQCGLQMRICRSQLNLLSGCLASQLDRERTSSVVRVLVRLYSTCARTAGIPQDITLLE